MEEIIRTDYIDSPVVYKGIVITDLDGTLLDSGKKIKDKDYNTLIHLHKTGFLRVIATGRHPYSLFKTIDKDFPVDYVIFSSGAGIWNVKKKQYVRIMTMEPCEVQKVVSSFYEFSLDFAIHKPIPDNHYFSYYLQTSDNYDFERRNALYKEFANRWMEIPDNHPHASQLLAIISNHSYFSLYEKVSAKLPGFSVIRTTSPLDHSSLWIEVFPHKVSKGRASSWLASQFRLKRDSVCAIGNDYNDLDLLSWAGNAYVVSNAPEELKNIFPVVAAHNECGFSEAVAKWLGN